MNSVYYTNQIKQIMEWFKKAVPNPTANNLSTQIGCHFEEVGELMEALPFIFTEANMIAEVGDFFKSANSLSVRNKLSNLNPEVKAAIADACADQIVTAVGILHMMSIDAEAVLGEVIRSNNSKFDADGNPIFNENGKIMKGENYTPPNLTQFIK